MTAHGTTRYGKDFECRISEGGGRILFLKYLTQVADGSRQTAQLFSSFYVPPLLSSDSQRWSNFQRGNLYPDPQLELLISARLLNCTLLTRIRLVSFHIRNPPGRPTPPKSEIVFSLPTYAQQRNALPGKRKLNHCLTIDCCNPFW